MRKADMNLPQIEPTRKEGKEPFTYNKEEIGITLLNFWQWANSDLIDNTARGVLAEFIVATALKLHMGVRKAWTPCDLTLTKEIGIEVKSAAYIQSWKQKNRSKIIFSIKPARAWNGQEGKLENERKRHAQIYVFALLKHDKKPTIDPLNLDQWTFFVISTKRLEEVFSKETKSVSLERLKQLQAIECSYADLPQSVLEAGKCY
jgi:hypothetical protein